MSYKINMSYIVKQSINKLKLLKNLYMSISQKLPIATLFPTIDLCQTSMAGKNRYARIARGEPCPR